MGAYVNGSGVQQVAIYGKESTRINILTLIQKDEFDRLVFLPVLP